MKEDFSSSHLDMQVEDLLKQADQAEAEGKKVWAQKLRVKASRLNDQSMRALGDKIKSRKSKSP